MNTESSVTGLVPLFIFFALLIFAALGWCMLSSCLGQSLGDLWRGLVLSAQYQNSTQPWRRRDWVDSEYEMEYRGRGRAA